MKRLVAACLIIGLSLSAPLWAEDKPCRRLLHTSATSEVVGENDSAMVHITMVTASASLQTAHKENATKADAVSQAIKKLSIPGLEVNTANFYVNPQRNFKDDSQTIIGYEIQNTLAITIEKLEKQKLSLGVSQVLDTALKHGANQIGEINFYIKEPTPLLKQALAQATKLAIEKAQALAKAASVKLGPLVELNSEPIPLQSYRALKFARGPNLAEAAAVPATPIEAGESQISATVSLSYEIQ